MSKVTKDEVKVAYAKAIEILFGGAVQATPNEINQASYSRCG